MNLSDISAPAVEPHIGGTYRLRNGAIVTITKAERWSSNRDIFFFVGDYNPPAWNKYTCQPCGHYAPEQGIRPHMLDVIEEISSAGA